MKLFSTFIALLVAGAGLTSAAGAAESAVDPTKGIVERAINQSYDRMIAAAEARKFDELFSFVTDEGKGVLAINGQLLRTRDDALAAVRNGFQGVAAVKYQINERVVTELSPTSALLVTTGVSTTELADGRRFSRPFTHTVVFVLQWGGWRVVHSHQSNLPLN